MKRTIALLLACAMLCPLFAACGKNARPAKREILVGKNKWVSKQEWQAAIRARKNGTATKEQKEMLDNGHWKPKK